MTMTAKTIQIFVKSQTGYLYTVNDVAIGETIAFVKEKIRDKSGFPVDRQKLMYRAKLLDNNRTLYDYCIQSEATLTLYIDLHRNTNKIQIFIQETNNKNKIIPLDLQSNDTVKTIKILIKNQLDIPIERQILRITENGNSSNILKDSETVKNGDTLILDEIYESKSKSNDNDNQNDIQSKYVLFIQIPDAQTLVFIHEEPSNLTIAEIKQVIFMKKGIPTHIQILFFNDAQLIDSKYINHYNIQSRSTLEVYTIDILYKSLKTALNKNEYLTKQTETLRRENTELCKLVNINGNNDNIHQFKVYAAIDFGTNGTGLAYCLPNNDQVFIHDKWKTWNKNKNQDINNIASIKPKTAILLHKTGKFKAFGDNALQIYMNMNDTTSLLFEHFKMHLYVQSTGDDDQKQCNGIKQHLHAMNGKKYPASLVFIEALKHLHKNAMHVFKRNKIKIKSNKDISWTITIPAIWGNEAKEKMTKWAISAGMIDKSISNHLLLPYEPNCASLSVRYEIKKHNKFILTENIIYALIDAGGGTVDVACHQILKNDSIKQLLPASGGPWGDMFIDTYFIDILNDMFNEEYVSEFKKEEPNCYLTLLDNFRQSKLTFDDNKLNKWHNVNIPFEFIEFMEDKLEDGDDDCELEEIVNKFVLNDLHIHCFKLEGESLKIHKVIWKLFLFNKLINPIINHCKMVLSHDNMKNCNILCLVGGFSAIKYFQDKIKSEFGSTSKYNLNIIIPERPILSVLDGAARMSKKKKHCIFEL